MQNLGHINAQIIIIKNMAGRLPKPSLPIAFEDAFRQELDRNPENIFLLTLVSAYWFLRYVAGCKGKSTGDLKIETAANLVSEWICTSVEDRGYVQAPKRAEEKIREDLRYTFENFLAGVSSIDNYCRYACSLAEWVQASFKGKRLRDLARSRGLGREVPRPVHPPSTDLAAEMLKREIAAHRKELQSRGRNPWEDREYIIRLLGYLTGPAPLGFALLLIILVSKEDSNDCTNDLENLLNIYNPFIDPMIPSSGLARLYAAMESEVGSIFAGLEKGILNLHMLHAWHRGKSKSNPWRVPIQSGNFKKYFTQAVHTRKSMLPIAVDSVFGSATKSPSPLAVPDRNPSEVLINIQLVGRKPLSLIHNHFDGRRLAIGIAEQVFNHELAQNPPRAPLWITGNLLGLSDKNNNIGETLEALDKHHRRFLEYLFINKASERLREIAD